MSTWLQSALIYDWPEYYPTRVERRALQARLRRQEPSRRASNRLYHKAWTIRNPNKFQLSQSKWRERNRENLKKAQLKRKYGLSVDDYHRLYAGQDGCCDICKKRLPTWSENKHGKSAIDHDHKTGKIRGLLCGKCNKGLGDFRESEKFLVSAIEYLKKNS